MVICQENAFNSETYWNQDEIECELKSRVKGLVS